MKRLFFFLIKLFVFAAFVILLASRPGTARIVWHGYVIETSAAVLVFTVLAAGFVFYFIWRSWRFIVNGPEMWRLRRKLGKMRDGHTRLAEGLAAVAAGDAAEAGRHAVAARKLLGTTASTRLLHAQAAQLAGDHDVAREIFLALAAEPESAVLGYRGLIMGALRAGKRDDAEKLIEKLRRLKPETPWLKLVDFELAARREAWGETNDVLDHIGKARLMDQSRVRKHQAAALVAKAKAEARAGNFAPALEAAERAVRLVPGWPPAAIALAEEQIRAGHKRAALRTIERAWSAAPHLQLARIYRMIVDDDAVGAYRQLEQLCRDAENRPLGHRVLAEAALEAKLWGEAREHLMHLVDRGDATRGVYQLLARLEHRENSNDQLATKWLARAIDAPADPAWLCRICGGAHEEWQALCRHCGGFDALEWQTPGVSRAGDEAPALYLESAGRFNE